MNKYMDKDYANHFDDDFEVIYDALDELDEYIDYDGGFDEPDDGDDMRFRDEYEEEVPPKRKRPDRSKDKERRAADASRCRDKEDDKDGRKRGRLKLPNLLSPAAKTVKAGGKAAGSVIRTILKGASLLLIAVIIVLLGVSFFHGHAAYGNPAAAVEQKNYALAAYFAFAALLLIFELISFFWTLSGQKIKDGRRIRKLDTGRGIGSFLVIYIGSYLSLHLGSLIPEVPQALGGLKGAVSVYGSLNQTLLPLCVMGVISCLIRKFIFH